MTTHTVGYLLAIKGAAGWVGPIDARNPQEARQKAVSLFLVDIEDVAMVKVDDR